MHGDCDCKKRNIRLIIDSTSADIVATSTSVHSFVSTAVSSADLTANQLTVSQAFYDSIVTGQRLTYDIGSESGTTILGGLTDNTIYFAIRVPNALKIKLAATLELASVGTALPLSTGSASGTHTLTATVYDQGEYSFIIPTMDIVQSDVMSCHLKVSRFHVGITSTEDANQTYILRLKNSGQMDSYDSITKTKTDVIAVNPNRQGHGVYFTSAESLAPVEVHSQILGGQYLTFQLNILGVGQYLPFKADIGWFAVLDFEIKLK